MIKNIITTFFIINALFWGLASHASHCNLVAQFGAKGCLPHSIHILMGLISFIIAIYIQQKDYINYFIF
tara:strand:- start:267 stop:473 length:207 start_codon:yes stop_codon:yes gene_type:complete